MDDDNLHPITHSSWKYPTRSGPSGTFVPLMLALGKSLHLVLEDSSTQPGTVQDVQSHTRTVGGLFIDGQDCLSTVQCSLSTVQVLFSDGKWLDHLHMGLATDWRLYQNSPHIVCIEAAHGHTFFRLDPYYLVSSPKTYTKVRGKIFCAPLPEETQTVQEFANFVPELYLASGDLTLHQSTF